jgi:16S rRNA (cytosine1402-N4)-methyltransferase
MVEEIVSIFADVPEGVFIDATIGLGGHSLAIQKEFSGKFILIGFDRDGEMLKQAESFLPEGFRLVNMTYSNIPSFLAEEKMGPVTGVLLMGPVTGVLFDLGLNSMQLEGGRGFSYSEPSLLDFRFDRSSGRPFHQMVSRFGLSELTGILKKYGQEKNSRAIARASYRQGDY